MAYIANSKTARLIFIVIWLSSSIGLLFLIAADQTLFAANHQLSDYHNVAAGPSPATAAGFGILGDSNSDEYRADDDRGGKFAAVTLNWMEQLVAKRGLNFGPWGTWGEPRRTGYKYNWARSGATASSLISSGQHTGLAQQVADGEVSYVFVWIGVNDFHTWNGTYAKIYDGSLSDAEVQAKVDRFVADVTLAVDTILKAGKAPVVVATVADVGLVPDTIAAFPDAAKRRRVTDAINQANAGLEAMAAERGVAIADAAKFGTSLVGRVDKDGMLNVGGQRINFLVQSDDPHHVRLSDSVGHGGTVVSGLIANSLFIEPFDSNYGLDIKPFSDEEILKNAGITGTSGPTGCLGSLSGLVALTSAIAAIKQLLKQLLN
jgi:phospholipase/lecithinase/hemolysin